MFNMESIIKILKNEAVSCIISDGEKILLKSSDKGIKPLLDFYKTTLGYEDDLLSGEIDFSSLNEAFKFLPNMYLILADKIIGKSAAFLCVIMNIQEVYAHVISAPAYDFLQKYGVKVSYGTKVPFISNRSGDGMCPLEASVLDEENFNKAMEKMTTTIRGLMGRK